MTTRRHYIVSYDISDDKRRTKVFESLLGRGDHAQFSVFFCQLNPQELAELRSEIISIVHHTEDQVLVVDLGPAHNPLEGGIEYIGKPFRVSTRVIVV
ncbi:MAG: CRISPR-associated endonuclease Cas2 [Burkholderiales bacterium]|nr:CRISPR-associated endonuclease Cas2 [Phycisphaerae bacterium]